MRASSATVPTRSKHVDRPVHHEHARGACEARVPSLRQPQPVPLGIGAVAPSPRTVSPPWSKF